MLRTNRPASSSPARRVNPFPSVIDRLEDRLTPSFGATGLLSSNAATGLPIAEVSAGSRLLSVSTTDSAILNGLLGSTLGTGAGLTLTAVDYTAIAGADVNLGSLLGALQAPLGVATPSQVLTTNLTLSQLFTAASSVAQASGNPAAAAAFGKVVPAVSGLTGPVQLGDLLDIDPTTGSLSNVELRGLDLLTGGVELFNDKNVLTTPAAVGISGAALGVPGVLNSVNVRTQVVEPPVFVIGPTGTTFATAQVRLKLNVDLVDTTLGNGQLSGILAPVLGILDPLRTGLVGVNASLTVGQLELYADVARGTGLIDTINLVANSVTLQATPAVADVYLGSIADAVFYNRGRAINPATDLTPGVVGSLSITATSLGVPLPINGLAPSLGVTLRAVGQAGAATPLSAVFTGPFPSSKTVGSSAAVIGNLVTDLVGSLQVGVTGTLGILNPVLNTITSTVGGAVAPVITPALNPLLTSVVDPLLNTLGIGVGEMDLTVAGLDVRNAPDAVNDSATTLQGRPVAVNVLANDVIPAASTPTFAIVTSPANGTLTVNADKTLKYTPAAAFLGADTFTYSLTDEFGQTDTATVTVFVGKGPGPNGAPQVNPDAATTAANTAVTINVLANDTDPNGDTLTLTGVSVPAHGTATANANGTVTYTPSAGFTGLDTFTYAASDGKGGVGMTTVTVGVGTPPPAPTNQVPVAVADTATTPQGSPATVNVLANDTDPDGGTLAIVGLSQPAGGTATLGAGGAVTYTPNAGFFGTDRFTYTISDGQGGTAGATVTVTVPRSNVGPAVNPDAVFTPPNTTVVIPVLANDTDPNGDTLTITGVTQPTGGTATITGTTVTFVPTPGFVGSTQFTYTAADGFGGSGTATVTVQVGTVAVNTAPVAGPDAAQTVVNTPVSLPVLANDTDADGDALVIVGTSSPAHGTLAVSGSMITYSPAAGYLGSDSFTYTVSDGKGGTATGTASITVGNGPPPIGTNHAPVINGDSAQTKAGVAVNIPVLANDTDADGDIITLVTVTQPANGTVTTNANGTLTYTPRAGFQGVDTFSYTGSDGQGGSGSATVQVVVVGADQQGPVIADLKQYAVGADTSGGPRVTVYNPDGSVKFNFFAYDPNTRFGVNVTLGDIDGDGVSDVITSPGKGGSAHVRVFSGKDLHELFSFFAFDSTFRGGCNIAVGDTNGDGRNDLVVSAGAGGGPRVRVLDGTKLTGISATGVDASPDVKIADFFAFAESFGGGTSVAVVDRNGDGIGEVATGAGPGGAPVVRIWNVKGQVQMLSEFMAFDPSVSAGVNVGGRGAYLVIGIGKGGPPQVRVFQGTTQTLVADFLAYEPSFTGGVRVNFGETVDPTKQVFLVGAGVGGGPRIKVLRPNLDVIVPDYFAFEDTFRGGVFVA